MDRRSLLKLLSLSTLALAGGASLAGCGDDTGPDPNPALDDITPVAADVPRIPGDDGAIPAVVKGMQTSGGALFGRLASTPGNLALSPYSVMVALAMTANGAVGETREQLETGLGGVTVEDANPGLNALTTHVEGLAGPREKSDGTRTEVVLDVANALFGQQDITWDQDFLDTLASQYGAGLQTVDYQNATEQARAAVNAWTAEKTHDKITEILPTGSVTGDTRLVLVDTVYLKAPWDSPFDKDLTEDGDFTLLDGTVVTTPLMRTGESLDTSMRTGPGWQSVQLPYAGREVAMTIVLPDEGRYADVEADVVAGNLAAYLADSNDPAESVQVTLPSFTFRTQAALGDALMALGVTLPFGDEADFSAMTTDEELYIAAVLQQVFVAVDEEGTEAAAATAVIMGTTSAPAQPLSVVVDRPFLFVIHDVEHGTPLFLGRVLDPRG